ncbi:MAG TPA: 2OG-Fe(II) oxygenase [Steroidobacteraceae bacterium]|nr:2OG-Fe(II) oxygenase [Steroidobacteraceae bacterium]
MSDIDLRTGDFAVRDEFLTPPQVRALIECAEMRRERGGFAGARIGAGRTLERREEIRGDSICWLTEPLYAPERALFRSLEELRLQLNRSAFLGLFESEWHYACYPPGAGYARHIDRPQSREQRRVSLVLYLNEQWQSSDGGVLRIFADDGGYSDIEPLGGRVVAFLTERREHAVMPTRRDRLSLTGWYRSREHYPLG